MKKAAVISIVFFLLFNVRGVARKLSSLPQVTTPITIEIYNDELYILDEATINVYSLKDFRIIRKFGDKGEDKGQLTPNTEVPLAMNIVNGNIYLNSQLKMIKYSTDGTILKEQQIPFSFQTIPFDQNYASIKLTVAPAVQRFSVIQFDPEFKQLKLLYSRDRIAHSRRGQLPIPPELIIIRSNGDKLFVFDQKKDFAIDVYKTDGTLEKTIKLNYQKIKVTDAFKKPAEAWFRAQPYYRMAAEELREMIYFPDYLPVMRNFIIKNKKLYIQTYKTNGNLNEFLVLDLDGKLLKQLMLPGFQNYPLQFNSSRIFTFENNKYYYLNESDTGWELHQEEIK